MSGVFQDNFHYEFSNSSIYMLNTQLVIDFEQSSELPYSSPLMLDIHHIIDFEQPPNLPNALTSMLSFLNPYPLFMISRIRKALTHYVMFNVYHLGLKKCVFHSTLPII